MIAWSGRVAAVVLGALLVALAASHRNPWDLAWLEVTAGGVDIGGFPALIRIPTSALIAGLLALGVACAVSTAPVRRAFGCAFGRARGRPAEILSAGIALVLFGVTLAPGPGEGERVLGQVLAALGTLLLLTGAAPLLSRLAHGTAQLGGAFARVFVSAPRWAFLAITCGFVFVAAALGSTFLFGNLPHVVDEMAQLFHAKIWLQGSLTAPLPEPAEFFRFTHMIDAGRWYSQYPPGHTLLLAIGKWAGAAWLVNPICAAVAVAVVYEIGREVYDELTARLAALAAALSPFVWLMASSHMNHTPMLLAFGGFVLGFFRVLTRGRLRDAVLAGMALGFAACIRPFSAAAVAVPFALFGIARCLSLLTERTRRSDGMQLVGSGLAMVAALAVPLALLLAYNSSTNGDPFLFGYQVLHGTESLPGFGRSGWSEIAHTPGQGLAWTLRYLNGLNQVLLPLSIPSLAPALLGVFWIRCKVWDALLLASFASLAAAYAFYWYGGWDMGPRFLFCAVAPLALLTARSVATLPNSLRRFMQWPQRVPVAGGIAVVLVASLLLGVGSKLPTLTAYYARNFGDANRAVYRSVSSAAPIDALVLVPDHYFGSFFVHNDPLLRRGVVYARDLGPDANRRLLAAFPDRPVYRVQSLARTGIVPYDPAGFPAQRIHAVPTDGPLEIDVLGFQVSYQLGSVLARNERTGRFGGGWKNHDQLVVDRAGPGAGVGFALKFERTERRSIAALMTRGPRFGIAEMIVNGRRIAGPIDLYAPAHGVVRVGVEAVEFASGRNDLSFRIIGRNPESRAYALGLDVVSIDAPSGPGSGSGPVPDSDPDG